MLRHCLLMMTIFLLCNIFAGVLAADKSESPAEPAKKPAVTGKWIGDWGPYNPVKEKQIDDDSCKLMECDVTYKDGVWYATFAGECSRPYKYEITMEGRQVGDVVLFKGTTDLGPKDGGVFDWIGRASDDEFAGFYTGGHYIGLFRLKRPVTVSATE